MRLQQEKESPKQDAPSAKKEPEIVWVGSTDPNATRITQKQLGWGCLTFVVFIVIVVWGISNGGLRGDEEEVTPPASPAAPANVWDNDISRDDCALVGVQVRNLQGLYDGDVFGGGASDLSSAAEVFEQVAAAYSGSDRDWLLKMAELSGQVSGGGAVPAKQLKANLGLVDQFCG